MDLSKSAGENWTRWSDDLNDNEINTSEWLYDLQPGESWGQWIILNMDPIYGYVKPGNYIASTTNPDIFLEIEESTGLTNIVNDLGESTFTILNSITPEGFILRLNVRNDGTEPTDLTDLQIVHEDQVVLVESGEIFDPQFLEDLSHLAVVRTMDWGAVNNSKITDVSQLPTESSRTWCNADQITPYSVQGKLADKLNSDLWLCVPQGTDSGGVSSFDSATNQITATGDIPWEENDGIYFYGDWWDLPEPFEYGTKYYIKDLVGNSFKLSLTPGGAALTIPVSVTEDIGCSITRIIDHAQLYADIAQQVYDSGYRGKIYVEWANEVWNFGFDAFQFAQCVMGPEFAGQYDAGLGYAHGATMAWQAFESRFGRENIIRVACGQSGWFALLSSFFDYVGPDGSVYEGQEMKDIIDTWAVAPYVSPGTVDDVFANGGETWTNAQWTAALEDNIDLVASNIADHISQLHSIAPGVPVTTYECGNHFARIGGDMMTQQELNMQNNWINFLDSDDGAAAYQYYYQKVFVENNLTLFNHFVAAGGWSSERSNYFAQWGLKPYHAPYESARWDWFKTLPKTNQE